MTPAIADEGGLCKQSEPQTDMHGEKPIAVAVSSAQNCQLGHYSIAVDVLLSRAAGYGIQVNGYSVDDVSFPYAIILGIHTWGEAPIRWRSHLQRPIDLWGTAATSPHFLHHSTLSFFPAVWLQKMVAVDVFTRLGHDPASAQRRAGASCHISTGSSSKPAPTSLSLNVGPVHKLVPG